MADATEDNKAHGEDRKGIFPFFQLSRELRDKIYLAMSLGCVDSRGYYERYFSTSRFTALTWYGYPDVDQLLICRRFAVEYKEECIRHTRVEIICDGPDRDLDVVDELCAVDEGFTFYKLVLDLATECTINLSLTAANAPAVEPMDYLQYLVNRLWTLVSKMPALRKLKDEYVYIHDCYDEDFSSSIEHWAPHGRRSVSFLDITKESLGFTGTLDIACFLTRSIFAYNEPGRVLPRHDWHRTPWHDAGIRRMWAATPSVHYRFTHFEKPTSATRLHLEVVGRSGDDQWFLAEMALGHDGALEPSVWQDYEREMAVEKEQQRIAEEHDGAPGIVEECQR